MTYEEFAQAFAAAFKKLTNGGLNTPEAIEGAAECGALEDEYPEYTEAFLESL